MPSQRLLLRSDIPLSIGSRALDLLIALVEHSGVTLSKEQLLAYAWPNVHVHEANLRVHIGGIRKLLGDGRDGQRFIVNEAGRGYCFVAPVLVTDDAAPATIESAPEQAATVIGESMRANLAPIIGRFTVIESLIDQISKKRFITIVGPGGIGKTTVALAVAGEFKRSRQRGACFVDLAPLTDPNLVYSQLTSALGILSRSDNQLAGLAAFLKDKDILIVFDNCERVIDAVTPLVEAIISAAPNIHVLTTSREPLRAKGEWIQRLAPLLIPQQNAQLTASEALAFPAIQLFVERARSSLDGFELGDRDASIVADICRKLDGLPLAIELAASRIDAFGVRGLAALLDGRVHLPSLARRTAAPRHRTLAATLDWSYETLPEPERIIFSRLGIFAGSFTLSSASRVAADSDMDEAAVVECVANLIEKSMVTADLSGVDVSYRLLDTTRAYALQKLSERNEYKTWARRHAEYYRTLFEQAEAERDRKPAEWLAAYRHEIDNVRAALDWAFSPLGDPALGVALTLAAVPLWTHLSLYVECRFRVVAALQTLDPAAAAQERVRMQLFAALGGASVLTIGFRPENLEALSNALTIAERIEDIDFQLRALWGLWTANLLRGQYRMLLELSQKFLKVARASEIKSDALAAERLLGLSLYFVGELDQARFHIEGMLSRYVAHPSHITRFQFDQRVLARSHLATILWLQGFPDRAMQTVETSVTEALRVGHPRSTSYAIGQAALPIAIYNGDLASAERYFALFHDLLTRNRSEWAESWIRCYEGVLLIKQGDLAAGTTRLRIALGELLMNSFNIRFLPLRGDLAEGLCDLGDSLGALTTIEEAIELSRRNEELWCLPELLRVRGEVALRRGDPDEAEDDFRQSLDWSRRLKALSWELRAATSLARSWQAQGRPNAAYRLLEPIFARFTEGFDTSDLRAAKTLLAACYKFRNEFPQEQAAQ